MILVLLLPAYVLAEQFYVSDELALDLRGGRGNEYRILRMLPAGTPVAVLEEEAGWTRVNALGLEGWVLTRLLTTELPARQRVVNAEATAQRLSQENARLRRELQELRGQHERLENESTVMRRDLETLLRDHRALAASAAEPHRLLEENQRLTQQVGELSERSEQYQLENAVLRTDVQRDWLIAGAVVLGSGLLLGLILPSLLRYRGRRRSEWA
jgi:SH3 domain protein